MSLQEFPTDWTRATVIVAHPDDPEYGMSAAVCRWTDDGKSVVYVMASSGEVGIEGMPAEQAGPLREQEQIASGAAVGVTDVQFLGFPDSQLRNDASLRAAIARVISSTNPDIVVTNFRGAEWAPGMPNQSDHVELGEAVVQTIRELPTTHHIRLFENGADATHVQYVGEHEVGKAIESLAQHAEYLRVLDPETSVREQATAQVHRVCYRDGADTAAVHFSEIDVRG